MKTLIVIIVIVAMYCLWRVCDGIKREILEKDYDDANE